MLVPAKPSLVPGILSAVVAPVTVLVSSWLLASWVGGLEGLSRLTTAAGPFVNLVVLSGLVEMAFLMLMLCQTSSGRAVPLAVMLGMATLPWTVGLLGTEALLGRALAGLREMEAVDAHTALALGSGEAMASRLLGAWTSATLLIALGLGVGLTRLCVAAPDSQVHRSRATSQAFGSLMAFALAATAVVGALEAHRLFEILTHLAQVPLAERAHFLGEAVNEVAHLRAVRWGGMALLALLGLALFVWKTRSGTHHALEWMGSVTFAAAVAALLLLGERPLRLATQGARTAGLERMALPPDFEPIHASGPFSVQPLAALATLEGLAPVEGPRLPWSSRPETLASLLARGLPSPQGDTAPAASITPEPSVALLADARLSGPAVRHLLEASARAGARSVKLVGQHPEAAPATALEQLEDKVPFFSLLAARPSTLRLLLPSALSRSGAITWHGQLTHGAVLRLSPVQGVGELTVSLRASPAEVPAALAGALVGLELTEDVSLKDLSAAADMLGLAGAYPVVLTGPSSPVAQPLGGTDTLGMSPTQDQSSQKSSAMPTSSPTPSTPSITSPSHFCSMALGPGIPGSD